MTYQKQPFKKAKDVMFVILMIHGKERSVQKVSSVLKLPVNYEMCGFGQQIGFNVCLMC